MKPERFPGKKTSLILMALLFMAPIVSAYEQDDMCAGKRNSLEKLEAEAQELREQIAKREWALKSLETYIDQVKAGTLDVAKLNKELEEITKAEKMSKRVGQYTPAMTELKDFYTAILAASNFGIIEEGRLRNQPIIHRANNEMKEVRLRQEAIGSQINILRQSIESLNCAAQFTVEHNTVRHGDIHKRFYLPSPDPELCRDACAKATWCRSYVYIKPEPNGQAQCSLSREPGDARPHECCISGVKR